MLCSPELSAMITVTAQELCSAVLFLISTSAVNLQSCDQHVQFASLQLCSACNILQLCF